MDEIFITHDSHSLRNPEHLLEHTEILQLIISTPLVEGLLPRKLIDAYVKALEYEDDSFNVMRKSKYSAELEKCDQERDLIFRGLVHTVKGLKDHFDPAKREAAQRVANVLAHYGDIASMTNDAESANIYDLNQELNSPRMTGDTQLLGLEEWLEKLIAANMAYNAVDRERMQENAENAKLNARAARRETDRLLRMLLNSIEILILTSPSSDLEKFIDELNAILKHYKHSANLAHAKHGETETGTETIIIEE